MRSDRDSETDVGITIQRTLISINDVSLKIKKELELIKEFVKENGHLHAVVNTANQALAMQAQEMGMNIEEIITDSERNDRLEPNLLGSITSTTVTEKFDQINV
ncbi:Uncharacterized protein DBV15_02482 [Temnothorax longispinosus]|uniref:Uncharacterized protein n=1 Tax=Temnothorax longispinosus TaxID=300112 RepID=A0A4S2KS16_9HYME|nr:Uncharacterized protein DBV15_02482 [Temnothorax longispinosus]